MKNRYLIYACLLFIVLAGIWNSPLDARGRKKPSADFQKQLEAAGIDSEDGQTREERLEELRRQGGDYEREEEKAAADVEIPTGTHVMVKLDKTLDSSEMGQGEQFTGRLQSDLVVDDVLMCKNGTKVYGTIVTSTRARNVADTSVLEFKLTGITIDGQIRYIESALIRVEEKKTGRKQAAATIEAQQVVEFIIGEQGSDMGQYETQIIAGPDKKTTDRVEERHDSRKNRRGR